MDFPARATISPGRRAASSKPARKVFVCHLDDQPAPAVDWDL